MSDIPQLNLPHRLLIDIQVGGPHHVASDVADLLQLAASETDCPVELRHLMLTILDDTIHDQITIDPVSYATKV